MPTAIPPRIVGALIPDTVITWLEDGVNIVPSGYAWQVECRARSSASVLFTKTTGFTTSATTLTIAWTTLDLGTLTAGSYVVELTGTAGGKARKYQLQLQVTAEVS